MELRICHLYPDVLNLYGDNGNIICMERRLRERGIDVSLTRLPIGQSAPLSDFDLLFLGGGQDFEQEILLDDLHHGKDAEICAAIEDGTCVLAICGGYQMLGAYYQNALGHRCAYLGAIDFYTESGKDRFIGNFAFQCAGEGGCVVGFENHSGRTHLGEGVEPLGHVLKGHGNNGQDGGEGVRYKNVFGAYSHGPVLPKNPEFCDTILRCALEHKYGTVELMPLDDAAEHAAHDVMLKRLHVHA